MLRLFFGLNAFWLMAILCAPACAEPTTLWVLDEKGVVEGALVVIQTFDRPPTYVPDDKELRTGTKGELIVNLTPFKDKKRLLIVVASKGRQGRKIIECPLGQWPSDVEIKLSLPAGKDATHTGGESDAAIHETRNIDFGDGNSFLDISRSTAD